MVFLLYCFVLLIVHDQKYTKISSPINKWLLEQFDIYILKGRMYFIFTLAHISNVR